MHGPARAAVGDEIGLAWTGTDRRLNLLITPDRRFGFGEIGWRDYACSSIGRRPPQIVG